MKLLGIDTTGIVTTAVLQNDGVFSCVEIPFKKHSENLFPALEKLLGDNKVNIKDIDCFGVVVGPGSFTGIRIGLAVIKTFAYVFGRKVIKVNSLEALAYTKFGTKLKGGFWCALDAGAGKAYAQEFKAGFEQVTGPKLIEVKDLAGVVNASDAKLVITPSPQLFEGVSIVVEEANFTPEALGELFKARVNANELIEYTEVNPLYLRLSQAEINIGLREGDAC